MTWVSASSFAAAVASSRRASSRRLADRFSCLLRFLRSALVRAGGAPAAASEGETELSSLSAVETGQSSAVSSNAANCEEQLTW